MDNRSLIHQIASFLRWRLVPVRYLSMLKRLNWKRIKQDSPFKGANIAELELQGYTKGPSMSYAAVQSAVATYEPRGQLIDPKPNGHPFINLFTESDIRHDNAVFQYAFSKDVLDSAADYFRGQLILDSIQVLYSYPTEGELRESQYWHLDYGDRRSFHCIAYLKDVLQPGDGPFVFVDKPTTKKVGRSIIVRRITDHQLSREIMGAPIQTFYGNAGNAVFVDPSACYHYGSRCKIPRLAIFVTFSSWFPFAQPIPLITKNKFRIFEQASIVRPDLNQNFIKSLLQISL